MHKYIIAGLLDAHGVVATKLLYHLLHTLVTRVVRKVRLHCQ